MEFAALDGSNINFTAYNRMIETFEKLNTQRIKEIGKLKINTFTRTRKMPFEDLVLCILSQKGKTIAMELNEYFKEINERDMAIQNINNMYSILGTDKKILTIFDRGIHFIKSFDLFEQITYKISF